MKVFPDTKLYIISGCPCDPDYEHTLYWPNKEGQHAYFMTKAKYRLDAMSYQRAKRGRIRVQYKVEDLYDCNYLAFQNSAFGNKWFYAFIDDVTYVNNITSEISYTIDVIQTWITEMDLKQSFVVREHSVTDNAGDNKVPEDVDIGDLVNITGWESVGSMDDNKPQIVVALTADPVEEGFTGQVNKGYFYGNIYSQAEFRSYSPDRDGMDSIKKMMDVIGIFNNPSCVTSIFMCPNSFLLSNLEKIKWKDSGIIPRELQLDEPVKLTRADGNTIKNNKLMTFPYTCLRVTNLNGTVRDYGYEYFAHPGDPYITPTFLFSESWTNKMSITITPRGYKCPLTSFNFDESITYDSFPQCNYGVSDFNSRMVNAAIGAGIGLIAGGTAIGAKATSAGVTMKETKAVESAKRLAPESIAEYEKAREGFELQNDLMQINTSAAALNSMLTSNNGLSMQAASAAGTDLFNNNFYGFYYAQVGLNPEYASRLDDYFSRYGYKTNLIKTPNISSRPHWNYVQTVGCKIGGSIPCTDEKLICSIFDKGVTFWKHPEEVGNFSLDNSPSST